MAINKSQWLQLLLKTKIEQTELLIDRQELIAREWDQHNLLVIIFLSCWWQKIPEEMSSRIEGSFEIIQ